MVKGKMKKGGKKKIRKIDTQKESDEKYCSREILCDIPGHKIIGH